METSFLFGPFTEVLRANGIEDRPTSVKNPQANAICERMHQTVANLLRTITLKHPPTNPQQARDLLDSCLAAASGALRIAIHTTMKISPGAAVFRRDMLLPVESLADWIFIQDNKQDLIDRNNRTENLRRFRKDYEVGDEVLIINKNQGGKLESKTIGPFSILQVHVNGTVTIQRGVYQERINIRRLKPFTREGGECIVPPLQDRQHV
ncbi:MAG: hypothetical protein ACREBR_01910 [bacterium]